MSRSTACKTQLCPSQRNYSLHLTVVLKLPFIPSSSERQSPPCALIVMLVVENQQRKICTTCSNGWLWLARRVPCPATVLFPDLTPAFQTKAVFFSQGAVVPSGNKIGNDRARACCSYPLPAGCRVNSESKGRRVEAEGRPRLTLK